MRCRWCEEAELDFLGVCDSCLLSLVVVRVRIEWPATPMGALRAFRDAPNLQGLPPGGASAERMWAIPVGGPYYVLCNEPLHDSYGYGDIVSCELPPRDVTENELESGEVSELTPVVRELVQQGSSHLIAEQLKRMRAMDMSELLFMRRLRNGEQMTIQSEAEVTITKTAIDNLQTARERLAATDEPDTENGRALRKVQLDALDAQLQDLRDELAEWENDHAPA